MEQKPHFAALDGLRGVAAGAVMLRHLGEAFHLPHLARHGYLAVDFFFVLSGFVISWAYEARLTGGLPRSEFLQRRAIRLAPVLILGSVLGAGVKLFAHEPPAMVIDAALLSMLALPYPWGGSLFPVNSPLWSMFYEGASNVAYAVVRPLVSRAALVSATVASACVLIVTGLHLGDLDVGFAAHGWWAGAPRLVYPFVAGMLIFRLHGNERVRAPAVPALLLAAVMCAIFLAPQGSGAARAMFDLSCSLVVLPALVWLGLSTHVGPRLAQSCVLAGELSYPVYAIHKPIEEAFSQLALRGAPLERAAAAAACAAVVIAAAWAAFRLYDLPFRRFLSEQLTRRPTPAAGLSQSA